MKNHGSLALWLRALSERRPGLFLAGLCAAFLLLLAVLTLLASGVRTEATAPAIELARVAGFGLVADANYISYLLHSGLTFALLLILAGVYRLTRTRYILYWGGAIAFLLALYLYMLGRVYLLSPAPGAGYVRLPGWDVYVTDALSFGSTLLVLFAAFQLLRIELPRRLKLVFGGLLFLGLLLLQRLYAGAAFLTLEHKSLLPGGALSMLALFLAGYGLCSRLSDRHGQRRLNAAFPLAIFLLYGAIQPGILLIHHAPYTLFVTTAAYILKALCTGVLIVLVLNETWQAKEREMLEADRARDEAEKAGKDLNRILNENELGYFRTDRSGLILQANRAEAQLLGYDSSDELKDRVNRLALLEDQEARRAIGSSSNRRGRCGTSATPCARTGRRSATSSPTCARCAAATTGRSRATRGSTATSRPRSCWTRRSSARTPCATASTKRFRAAPRWRSSSAPSWRSERGSPRPAAGRSCWSATRRRSRRSSWSSRRPGRGPRAARGTSSPSRLRSGSVRGCRSWRPRPPPASCSTCRRPSSAPNSPASSPTRFR